MSRRPHTSAALILVLTLGGHLVATPPEPVPVPASLLGQAPYSATGIVSARVPEGMILGSGSAVGARVVLTAAHVFFDDERLGWNSGTWTWQRVATPATLGSYYDQLNARSMHVLAGYASAVQSYSSESGVSLEEFNRDTLCLTFYTDVSGGRLMPLVPNAAGIAGLKMTVGYPVELPSGTQTIGQMTAHGPGGLTANFSRLGAGTDRAGYTNQVYRTTQITSGPGGSGGPLVSALDSTWKQTGVLVGGSSDFSSILVRQIDDEVLALVTTANNDVSNPGPGGGSGEVRTEAWVVTNLPQSIDVFFRENGEAILASEGMLRFLNPDGSEARRFNLPILSPRQVAEAPNGAIYVSEAYGILAISPDTGEILWRFNSGRNRFAVGIDSTLYTAASFPTNGMCAVSPQGTLEWVAPAGTNISTDDTPLAVLKDGTIVFQVPGGIKAFLPTGQERWSRDLDGLPLGQTLAIGPDDSIYVAGFGPILYALRPDTGVTKWSYAFASGSTPGPPAVGDDGTIYIGNTGTIRVLSPAGALVRSIALPAGDYTSPYLAIGSDNTIYASTSNQGVLALTSLGGRKWRYAEGGGRLRLSPTGQLYTQGIATLWDTLRVVAADSGPAPGTWNPLSGGRDGGCRAHNATPGLPRLPGWMTNQKVEPGTPFSLHMRTAGAGPMSYVWNHDGNAVSGAIGSTLSIASTSSTDAGAYTVTVTNARGSVTSSPATITVGAATAGEQLWQTPILNSLGLPAIAEDGTIFTAGRLASDATGPTYVFALDASGNEKWRRLIAGYDITHLMVSDTGGVFGTTASRGLFALSSSGGARWTENRSGADTNIQLALTQDGDPIVTGAAQNGFAMIARVSAVDGRPLWSHGSSSWINNGTPAARVAPDGTIFAGFGETIRAYTPAGSQLWEKPGIGLLQGFEGAQSVYAIKSLSGVVRGIRIDGSGDYAIGGVSGGWPYPVLRRPDGGYVSHRGICRDDGAPIIYIPGEWYPIAVDAENNAYGMTGGKVVGYDANGAPSFEMTPGTMPHAILTRSSRWIGGSPVACFKAVAPLSADLWPLADGDPGSTNRLSPTLHPVPTLVGRSLTSEGRSGSRLALDIDVKSTLPLTYQWWHDETIVDGATLNRLVLDPLEPSDAGAYRVVATAANGWTIAANWQVTVVPSSARTGYYHGESGTLVVMGHVTPDERLTLVAAAPDGGFVVRNLTLDPSSWTSFTISEGVPNGPSGVMIQNSVLTLALPDGRNIDLARTGSEQQMSPRPDTYHGGIIGATDGRLDMIVDSTGRWAWRLAEGARATSGTAATPPTGSTSDVGAMLATFHANGTFTGRTLPETQPANRLFAGAQSLGLRSRLSNISTRGYLRPGAEPMVAGFVTHGSEDQRLLLRAIGPGLTKFGIVAAAQAVRLDLFQGANQVANNQFWWSGTDPDGIRAASRQVSAFDIESYSLDSALYSALSPGLFTVHMSPADEHGGIALVEVYDNGTERGALRTTHAVNLSTRGYTGAGEQVLIAGFVIEGEVPQRILLRGIGPGLGPFSVTEFCTDPSLTLYDRFGTALGSNDSWHAQGTAAMRDAFVRVGSFDLPEGSTDAAMVVYLEPGVYTAMVHAPVGGEGTALVEVYELEW